MSFLIVRVNVLFCPLKKKKNLKRSCNCSHQMTLEADWSIGKAVVDLKVFFFFDI